MMHQEGGGAYRHEAVLYDDEPQFLDVTSRFVLAGLEADEPVLVVLPAQKVAALRDCLGRAAAAEVCFADMGDVGRNPARIIPAWRDFVKVHGADAGRRVRGIGEPIFAERSSAALVESQIHEALLDVAFADDPAFELLCPYDRTLGPGVIEEAHRSHRRVHGNGGSAAGAGAFDPTSAVVFGREWPLSPVPASAATMSFGDGDGATNDISAVRAFVADRVVSLVDAHRLFELTLAASELAANSVRHGGGAGAIAVWHDAERVCCEVRDAGSITDPLAGRLAPATDRSGGRGLWMANQLCDLVQIRSGPYGTVVRLHLDR